MMLGGGACSAMVTIVEHEHGDLKIKLHFT